MRLPLQISFHNMAHDAEIESAIRANARWLESYYDRIISCRVVVDIPHLHHKERNLYQFRIDLKVPGGELVVKRGASEDSEFQDLDLTIRDAFDDVRRQLEDYIRLRRGEVKAHETLPHARVGKIFPEAGYGFLETTEGREIYFHRNSVLKANFKDLEVGTEVRFAEEQGDNGPQASTVTPVGRHGHV